MSAERPLAHFEKITDAPDAIGRLRRFILDLAVRGKLVPQDPNDEPASDLLNRIAKEKARLVKEGEIRKPPTLEPVTDSEALYALPRTWAWVRVGNIFDYDAGTKRDPKELNQSRWLLELEDIEKDTSRIVERLRVSDRDSQSTKSEFEPGDILYGKLRPYLNKVVVADEPGYSTTEIVAIRPFLRLCPDYCALAFRRPDFVDYVERLGRGTKMPRLRTPDAIVAPFPLPPLAEQRRIVAKVDVLMGLCDRLEAARAGREGARDRLAAASLARLNTPDPETFESDTRFAFDALLALTTRPDQIKRLRQTILNLAVRGKLVSQDPGDEPASLVLKRRKIKPSADEPFQLPTAWSWISVGSVAEARLGKMLDAAKNVGIPRKYLRNINVRWFNFDLSNLLEMPFRDSELPEFALCSGDVLICEGGEPGRAAVWDERQNDIYFQKAIHRVRFPNFVDGFYFVNALRASADDGRLSEYFTGTGIKHFTGRGLDSYIFPLPPLAEQHRIVAKVNELMAICHHLEASLTTADETRRRLLDALLAQALAPVDSRELEAAE